MDLFAKVTAEFIQQTLPYNSKVTIYFFPFLLRTQTSYLNNIWESKKETKWWNQNSVQSFTGKITTMAENFLRWGVTFQRTLITVCSPELCGSWISYIQHHQSMEDPHLSSGMTASAHIWAAESNPESLHQNAVHLHLSFSFPSITSRGENLISRWNCTVCLAWLIQPKIFQ